MIHREVDIKVAGSNENAKLVTYILDISNEFYTQERPLILVCPGGGYHRTTPREAGIIALQFNAMGYHAAVLEYSCTPAVFPTALQEIGKSVAFLRKQAKEWKIDADKIAVMGFSAGAHVAGSLGVFWSREEYWREIGLKTDQVRPDAMILCYPVVTSGPYAHRGSFDNLLGEKRKDPKMLDLVSLEKQVTEKTPPTFLWHTTDDAGVPVQNSLLMTNALIEHGVSVEYHLFREGVHGLGLSDWRTRSNTGSEVSACAVPWISLLHTWLENWR